MLLFSSSPHFAFALVAIVVACCTSIRPVSAISITELMASCLEFIQSASGGGGGGGAALHISNNNISICLQSDGSLVTGDGTSTMTSTGGGRGQAVAFAGASSSGSGRGRVLSSPVVSMGESTTAWRHNDRLGPPHADLQPIKFDDELDIIGKSTTSWRFDGTPRDTRPPNDLKTRETDDSNDEAVAVAPRRSPRGRTDTSTAQPDPPAAPPASASSGSDDDYGDDDAPAAPAPAAPAAPAPAASSSDDDDYGDDEAAPAPAPAAEPAPAASSSDDDDYGDDDAPAPAAPSPKPKPSPPVDSDPPASSSGKDKAFKPDRFFQPVVDDAHLSPFSSSFKSLVASLVKVLTRNYIVLGKDYFKWYKPRMAANAELIKHTIGVTGDLQAIIPALLRHENAIWKHTTDYLATIEAYVEPLLDMIEKRVCVRLTSKQMRDRTVRDAIDLYHRVIPDAEYDYQDNLDICRNRYKHDLDDQLDGLLHLQQRAKDYPEENRNGELQKEYEAFFDKKQKMLIKTMAEYWNKVKAIYFHYLANIESSSNYLLSLVN